MATKRLVLAVTFLLLLTSSCDNGGPQLPVEPPFQGKVEGVVSAEGSVLPGVAVKLTGTRFLACQTAASGRFSFPDLPEGDYMVEIDGFPENVEFSVTTKPTSLQRGTANAKVDFKGSKKRDAEIYGTVAVDGAGLPEIVVSVSGPEARSSTTDSQGAFSFSGLLRGVYSLTIAGYDPALHAFPNDSQSANVRNGKAAEVNFTGTLVPQPPAPPTGLGAVATGSSTVSLSWTDASDDETRFDIERKVGTTGTWNQIGAPGPNTTTFDDMGLSPNTAYSYRVRACNDTGCSEFTGEAEATTDEVAPHSPTGLEALATGPSTVALTWTDGSTNEDRFELERKPAAGGSWNQIGMPGADATAFGDTGLHPNTTYTYRIRACNEVGCSDYSGEAETTTDEVPPHAPSSLLASPTGSTSVFLAWTDESENEDRFDIQRTNGPGGIWVLIGSVGADTPVFADAGLTPNTVYTYRVRACNVAGCSAYSNEGSAVTNEIPPEAPTELAATATGPYTVDLTWTDASDNESTFRLERRVSPSGSWVEVATPAVNNTAAADGGLSPNTSYAYRLRACNDVGCSAYSNEAVVITADVPPAAPSSLSAAPTGSTSVTLSWADGSTNEDLFRVERREGAMGSWAQVGTTGANSTSFIDGGLTPSTTYFYRVRACNAVGCSAFSSEANATTNQAPPSAPTGMTASSVPLTTIDLGWTDNSTDETSFRVDRKEGVAGAWGEIVTLPANSTSHSDTGLGFNTSYFYRVFACNGGGCSPSSNQASATTWDNVPDAPSGMVPTVTGSTTVDLAWTDASGNETGFRVERDEAGAGTFAFSAVLPANSTSFADSGLTPNTMYSYRVFAFNASGEAVSGTESVTTWVGGGPNLTIGNLYLTQSTQTLVGDVPLVANRDGYLRVFALASESNTFQPTVRVQFFHGGSPVHTETLLAPGTAVPTSVDESTLAASWNVPVPGALIQPGLSILADVDPSNSVAEGDEGDNYFPVSGSPQAMDVRAISDFEVTFVPIRQSVNNLLGNVTVGNASQYMDVTMRMLPIAQADVDVHAEYVTNAPALESNNGNGAWGTILSEINSLRVAEGTSRYYYGVVKTSYGGGVAGMGYLGWPAAIGWDHLPSGSGVAAHEWGHNWDLRHSPGCGAGSPDPLYPYADGKIGVWGLDVITEALKSPDTRYDFMTYCNPDWISDYTYEKILEYRQMHGGQGAPGGPEPSLLVWGRVEAGRIILEPAFEVTTLPALPLESGDYVLQGADQSGIALFSLSFQPIPVPDAGEAEGHFAFAIPLRTFDRGALSELRVAGGGRAPATMERRVGPQGVAATQPEFTPIGASAVEMQWDAGSFPMALVRDPNTGEVLSFARNGRIELPVVSGEVEVLFSDGLSSPERIRRTVR
ncbi:MAG: hypothetical protein HKO65_14200 [Gemmatimonadetes bacterium]|nr:fibronectin type III domain-containing protein [Gemmatimonadota bacterium]NNM06238.1 hypothetical protein [Gemmatimonadota bacterium]